MLLATKTIKEPLKVERMKVKPLKVDRMKVKPLGMERMKVKSLTVERVKVKIVWVERYPTCPQVAPRVAASLQDQPPHQAVYAFAMRAIYRLYREWCMFTI